MIQAQVWRHWGWCGLNYGERVAVFRGTLINEFGDKNQLIKEEGFQTHFSTFNMNEKVIKFYISKLNSTRFGLIRGYPGSLEIIGRFILDHKIKLKKKPKAIHTSSEVLTETQREVLQEAFSAPVFDWYSHGESTISAGECEHHEGLHINLELGLHELIKTSDEMNSQKTYNIISTSLWNYSMPFIRYDTEDIAVFSGKKSLCGRGLPLFDKILGRQADIIKGLNGVLIAPSSCDPRDRKI